MRPALFILCIFALSACDREETVIEISPGKEIHLWYGSKGLMPDDETIIQWTVTEDSRCPNGSLCAWEGRAMIEFRLEKGGQTQTIEIESRDGRNTGEIDGFEITVAEVTPYPQEGLPIADDDYDVWVRVEEI